MENVGRNLTTTRVPKPRSQEAINALFLPQQILRADGKVLLNLDSPNGRYPARISHVGGIEHSRYGLGAHKVVQILCNSLRIESTFDHQIGMF